MSEKFQLLMVEDDPGDVDLAREALKTVGDVSVALNVVEDGDKAMAFLRGREPYGGAPRPDLILLDLNLPRKDGREVLQEVKADSSLKSIPVLVFTTSTAVKDIEASYLYGANCYITKPFEFAQYRRIFKSICEFWLQIASLGPRP